MRSPGIKEVRLMNTRGGLAPRPRIARTCALLFAAMAIAGFSASRAMAQQAPAATGLGGSWEGTLGGQLRLVVTISKTSSGDLAGQLNSVDQGATLPIEKATLFEGEVRFEVSRVGGLYEGKMNETGSEIHGTWMTTEVLEHPLPL